MTGLLTPPRRHRHEILDDPGVDPRIVRRSLRDVALANRLFGGRRAAICAIIAVTSEHAGASLLDVGTGLADIPAFARKRAHDAGAWLRTIGLEIVPALAEAAKGRLDAVVRGDALSLPFADHSVDIVMCSQLLHHFRRPEALTLLREMHRVARIRVIVADLRRSWFAAAGLWVASFPLRFHPVSRHDGVVSILRGFTTDELSTLVEEAVGRKPRIECSAMFRVTATWPPAVEERAC